jgi:hypothetical protein
MFAILTSWFLAVAPYRRRLLGGHRARSLTPLFMNMLVTTLSYPCKKSICYTGCHKYVPFEIRTI